MKSVTLGQAMQVRKLATDKGISHAIFQSRLDDGTVARFLDTINVPKPMSGNLAPRGTYAVTLEAPHDPDAFYRSRSGLYVWDDFRNRVVAKAKLSEMGLTHKVRAAELMRDLTDAEIENALGAGYLFDETAVCAIIVGLISKQPNGEEGALLNNGYANLFYLSSCVVYVVWNSDGRGWDVDTWRRGRNGWDAGGQVFSPAN